MEVEYEMIRHGQRLRGFPSAAFTWRDLLVVVTCAADDSPLRRAAASDCGHSTSEHLGLAAQYLLEVGNWQRGSGKKKDQPKPLTCLLPPGMRPEVQQIGDAKMGLAEAAGWLGWSLPSMN